MRRRVPRTVAFKFEPLAAKRQLASTEVAMPTRTVSWGLLDVARRGRLRGAELTARLHHKRPRRRR